MNSKLKTFKICANFTDFHREGRYTCPGGRCQGERQEILKNFALFVGFAVQLLKVSSNQLGIKMDSKKTIHEFLFSLSFTLWRSQENV